MSAKRYLLAAAVTALALGVIGTTANAAGIFTLESNTFKDGQLMPMKVSNSKTNEPSRANCVGENVSPELHWSNVPDGTKSLVLLMADPQGRAPAGVSHWVAYGIAPTLTGFAEGATSKDSNQYVGGKSTMGVGHYIGPCTPPNVSAHHYTFVLIASDFAPDELAPGLTREQLIEKFGASPHVKGSTGMVGLFVNPHPK